MATWSYFHSRVLPHVRECTIPLVDQALRDSAADLAARSRIWREWLDPITTTTAREYDMDPPTGSMIVRPELVKLDGREIDLESSLSYRSPPLTADDLGPGASTQDLATVALTFSPAAGQLLQLHVSLAPAVQSTGVPDWIAARYMAGIVSGALARLRAIPGYAFSDPLMALSDQAAADLVVARAVSDAWRGLSSARPRSRPSWC